MANLHEMSVADRAEWSKPCVLGVGFGEQTLEERRQRRLLEALVEALQPHLVAQLVHQILDEDAAAQRQHLARGRGTAASLELVVSSSLRWMISSTFHGMASEKSRWPKILASLRSLFESSRWIVAYCGG